MTEELTETIRLATQWLFAPLLGLVALAWLCVRLEASGVFAAIRSAVRKMSVFQRFAAAAFLAVFIVFAGEKTNAPNVELGMENVELSQLPSPGATSILHSPFSILNSFSGLPVPLPAEPFALPTEGAATNTRWLVRGAFEDAVRLPFPGEDGFPWRGGVATALTVFACGEFRPDASAEYFPAPYVDPVSLPPLWRQDADAPSVFWHDTTPSNSLIATWENALYGRDAASPTNFQAEFFADGSFIYRYPDHATLYPPVLPFDYDGDGLENSVDPDPEVPGPDAHGTNAQWYNTVCSNILVATEATNCVPPVSLSWLEGVNSNAYYFVDVVATRGPAPICFFDASGRMPDDPVVVARAGETNRVPLVIGVEYAVTSSVPFTVSVPFDTIGRTPDGTLTVEPREGGGTTVHWPIRFSYVEEEGSTTDFTLDVQPSGLGLEYSWHVSNVELRMENVELPPSLPFGGVSILHSPFYILHSTFPSCFQADGTNVMLICQGDCGCDGCTLEGNAYLMGHSFSLPTFQCGCSPPTDPDQEPPGEPDPSRPSISVSYNAPAVIYEAAYVDVPGHTVGRRSTQATLSISVGSGPRGGHYSVNLPGFGRLVQTEPANIPVSGDLGPYETVFFSVTCEGCAPSSEEEDVEISGTFVENETGCRFTSNGSKLTVFRVELKQTIVPVGDTAAGRHTFGVNELVECNQHPSIPLLEWDTSGGGTMCIVSEKEHYRCPLFACGNPLSIRFGSIVYGPQLSILAPTGVVARNPHVYKFTNVPDGHAGGLGLAQEFHVLPNNVSFSQIAVEEVPCDSSQLTGYFRKLADSGDPAPFSHTTNAGAGVWFNVNELNRIGGNEQIEDMVSIKGELYRMFPDGTLTTNTACGWLRGTMVWENPFGWNANDVSSGTSAYGQFAVSQTNVNDVFVITTNGHFSVSKFGNTAIRACGGGCYLNGSPTIPTEVFWDGTD